MIDRTEEARWQSLNGPVTSSLTGVVQPDLISYADGESFFKTPRALVRRFICPFKYCRAAVGQPCKRKNGQDRVASHIARVRKAEQYIRDHPEAGPSRL